MNISKQTRRSISMNGDLYKKFRAWCQTQNIAMAATVEAMVARYLDSVDCPSCKVNGPNCVEHPG